MGVVVKIIDNSAKVKKQLRKNIGRALSDLGNEWEIVAAEEIMAQPRMGSMAGSALGAVDTGLMRDSNTHVVDLESGELIIGNPLNYALYTTYGTWKMPARPWFQNSVLEHSERYKKVVEEALKEGFGK